MEKMIRSDIRFILIVLLAGLVVRFAMMVSYQHLWLSGGKPDLIAPDGEWFSQRGWYISQVLLGKADYATPSNESVFRGYNRVVDSYKRKLPPFNSRGNGLFTYFIGLVYFLFGYSPLIIKSFNICVSAASSIVLYLIALEISTRRAAKISLILFTFFPSIVVFSITALRDPLIILSSLSILYLLIRLNDGVTLKKIAALISFLALVLFLREELFLIMALVTIIVTIANKKFAYKIQLVLMAVLVVSIVMTSGLFHRINVNPLTAIRNIAPVVFFKHAGYSLGEGRLGYKIFPEKYYDSYKRYASDDEYLRSADKMTLRVFLKELPKSIWYYLTRPFPFVREDLIYRLMSLQMLCWYAILILSVFGVWNVRLKAAYPIFVYVALALFFSSVTEGNEGILFRHRDCVSPFFILFASAAQMPFAFWRKRVD